MRVFKLSSMMGLMLAAFASSAQAQFSSQSLKPLERLHEEKIEALRRCLERSQASEKLQQSMVFTSRETMYNPSLAPLPSFLVERKQPFVFQPSLSLYCQRSYVSAPSVTVITGGATSTIIINPRVLTLPCYSIQLNGGCSRSTTGKVIVHNTGREKR